MSEIGVSLTQQPADLATLADLCQVGGAALAGFHLTSTRHVGQTYAARPWLLQRRHLVSSMRWSGAGQARATVMAGYESSAGLRAAVDEVAERWSERHWIHGDLGVDSVLVEHRPVLRVHLTGLDGAGLGDPAWDLASAIDTITRLAPVWQAPAEVLVDYLMQGYRRASGPGRLYPAMQAVRAFATAWELAKVTDATASGSVTGQPVPAGAGTPTEVMDWLERSRAHARRAVTSELAVA